MGQWTAHTHKDRRKLVKKVIGKRICDALPIKMAKNCEYKKEDIVNTVLFFNSRQCLHRVRIREDEKERH